MTARQSAVAYISAALVFLAMDAVWLTLTADRLYRPALGHLMTDGFDIKAAALFYALYIGGLVFFAVAPAVGAGARWPAALGRGALFGLVAYATYDLTNQATLRGWPWAITLADLCWGSVVTGVASAAACAIVQKSTPRRGAGSGLHQQP